MDSMSDIAGTGFVQEEKATVNSMILSSNIMRKSFSQPRHSLNSSHKLEQPSPSQLQQLKQSSKRNGSFDIHTIFHRLPSVACLDEREPQSFNTDFDPYRFHSFFPAAAVAAAAETTILESNSQQYPTSYPLLDSENIMPSQKEISQQHLNEPIRQESQLISEVERITVCPSINLIDDSSRIKEENKRIPTQTFDDLNIQKNLIPTKYPEILSNIPPQSFQSQYQSESQDVLAYIPNQFNNNYNNPASFPQQSAFFYNQQQQFQSESIGNSTPHIESEKQIEFQSQYSAYSKGGCFQQSNQQQQEQIMFQIAINPSDFEQVNNQQSQYSHQNYQTPAKVESYDQSAQYPTAVQNDNGYGQQYNTTIKYMKTNDTLLSCPNVYSSSSFYSTANAQGNGVKEEQTNSLLEQNPSNYCYGNTNKSNVYSSYLDNQSSTPSYHRFASSANRSNQILSSHSIDQEPDYPPTTCNALPQIGSNQFLDQFYHSNNTASYSHNIQNGYLLQPFPQQQQYQQMNQSEEPMLSVDLSLANTTTESAQQQITQMNLQQIPGQHYNQIVQSSHNNNNNNNNEISVVTQKVISSAFSLNSHHLSSVEFPNSSTQQPEEGIDESQQQFNIRRRANTSESTLIFDNIKPRKYLKKPSKQLREHYNNKDGKSGIDSALLDAEECVMTRRNTFSSSTTTSTYCTIYEETQGTAATSTPAGMSNFTPKKLKKSKMCPYNIESDKSNGSPSSNTNYASSPFDLNFGSSNDDHLMDHHRTDEEDEIDEDDSSVKLSNKSKTRRIGCASAGHSPRLKAESWNDGNFLATGEGSPSLSSAKNKFDTKNLVKNFLNQFLSFVLAEEESVGISELLGFQQQSGLEIYQEQLKSFFKNKKFNRVLLKEFIQSEEYRKLFCFFLENRAHEWISCGRMKDKASHFRALSNFIYICNNHSEIKSWRFRYNFV